MINLEQFVRIFRSKISHGKKKRMEAITKYFAVKYERQYEFETSEQCLEIICSFIQEHPEFEQQVFVDIIDLLYDRYSLGEPYIAYNLSVTRGVTFNEISQSISGFFRNTIVRNMFDFESDNVEEIDRVGETIKIRCRYKEYKKDIINDTRSDEVNHSGQIPIFFDFQRNKVLISTGYQKASNTIAKAFNESLTNVKLKDIVVKDDVRTMPNLIGGEYHPLTLLSIYLMLHGLNNRNYIVNDILSISFNNDEAPRVKRARLGGTNLLQDSDVIHRIYRGDCITNFILSIVHLNEMDEYDLSAEVLFDFRSGLKLSFFDLQIPGSITIEDASLEIENVIQQSISNPDTVATTQELINENLMRLEANNTELLSRVIRDLRDNICEIVENEDIRSQIERFINQTYRL
ncbi:hypothetical protein [Bacillus thuringiensis]|uniref:hypothetical protein n=1 Tax=Bacillus thuringiensis TaxID=1428 RepID=UPI0011A89393|nr:hypothetical protein [Bacillus thuringiensis]MCU5437825.1 hypothetical protein [Bacillus cereus]